MLKPRPLPPAHKNQLSVPVKFIGFFDEDPTPAPTFFRHHEVAKKRFKHKPSGVFSPSTPGWHHGDTHDSPDEKLTSSKSTITSMIHVRGRASVTDVSDVALNVDVSPRTKPMTPEREEVMTPLTSPSFLTEDPYSHRSHDGVSPVLSPPLDCSKYTVIGEPRFRKKRRKDQGWTLPRLVPEKESADSDHSHHINQHSPRLNSIDVKSIYGSKSKMKQVPPVTVVREESIVLPPLEIGRRRRDAEASVDAGNLTERRLVLHNHRQRGHYRHMVRDNVVFPASYKPYFRFRQRQHKFVRSLLSADDVWENNRQPLHCSRCSHHNTATLHFCDVLGKRFCRFCSEATERAFSHAYEGSRLLAPSPNKSPTLAMLREPSFIGVRKVIITKTGKEGSQGEGRDLEGEGGEGEGQKDSGEGKKGES